MSLDPSRPTSPPISLEAATREVAAVSFGGDEAGGETSPGSGITPQDWRENLKLIISGVLAGSLWVILGAVIAYHFWEVAQFSAELAKLRGGTAKDDAEMIQRGIAAVNDTAKTLYAFLTPLAAGVTGYFFNVTKNG